MSMPKHKDELHRRNKGHLSNPMTQVTIMTNRNREVVINRVRYERRDMRRRSEDNTRYIGDKYVVKKHNASEFRNEDEEMIQ